MASPGLDRRSGWGYFGAILFSALGHVGLAVFVLLALPRFLTSRRPPPPVYTVKIVDAIPAGDLGTHLPRLSHSAAEPPKAEREPRPPKPPEVKPQPPPPPPEDKGAIALNAAKTASPTPTPRATPKPPPAERSHEKPKPKATASPEIAKPEKTPTVQERLAQVREQLLARHLAEAKKHPPIVAKEEEEESEEQPAEEETSGGGPVKAEVASAGSGIGVGGEPKGGGGIQQNLDFLLYYRTVQERIKKAWSFPGGNNDLTTTVNFAIAPDGGLTGVRVTQSSKDSAFDESVIRAIKRAAPFPAPPDRYRGQFAQGIEAVFRLGELSS